MRVRIAVIAGSIITAGSIVAAIAIHRTLIYCSYLGGQPAPPCSHPTDYPLDLRIGIVAAGLIVAAVTILVGGGIWRHR